MLSKKRHRCVIYIRRKGRVILFFSTILSSLPDASDKNSRGKDSIMFPSIRSIWSDGFGELEFDLISRTRDGSTSETIIVKSIKESTSVRQRESWLTRRCRKFSTQWIHPFGSTHFGEQQHFHRQPTDGAVSPLVFYTVANSKDWSPTWWFCPVHNWQCPRLNCSSNRWGRLWSNVI